MTGVDNKVVSIKFDNAGFQQKVTETMASIDQLNTKLSMPTAKSGLSGIAESVGSFNMNPISASIDGISAKFLALSTVAITALSNIVNKAVDSGLAIAKSLTIAPITQGFAEYELKMGSIQTIMAGSGASLDTVNQKLEELNAYSDKTIYSFGDMTSNIGKFTNAGVSLDDSVAAIQGVANVAALSGANANEASRAMYNFGQAIGTGSVKLMDWKSIELANMGTVEFKQQLMDSAVAAGTLTKSSDGLYKTLTGAEVTTSNFNTTLQEQWLTSEALTTTLGRYADETTDVGKRATAAATEVKTFSMLMDTVKESVGSGWAATSEVIFGNFDEAKALWTSLNNVISGYVSASAKARNDMLGGWKNMGGRDVMIQAFKDLGYAIKNIVDPIKDAFREVFPKKTAGDLVLITGKIGDFAEKIKNWVAFEAPIGLIKRAFEGFFSIFKIGFEIVKGVFGVFGTIASSFSGAGGGALEFAANLGDMIVKLRESLVEGGGIARFFSNIGEYAAKAVGYITNFVSAIAGFFASLGGSGAEVASDGIKKVGERLSFLQTIAQGAGRVWDFLVSAFGKVKEALAPIGEMFSNIGSAIVDAFKPGNMSGALDALNVGLLGGIALLIKKFVDGGLKIDLGDGLFEKIGNTFDQLTGTLEAMQMKLKAEALMKIATAIGILTASVLVLSLIDSAALTKAMTAMAVGFGQLIGAMAMIDKFSDTSSGAKLVAIAGGMILLSVAVLILSFAIRSLSGLSWTELGKGLAGVGASMLLFAGAAKLLEGNSKGLIRAGIAMGAMAIGLIIMSYAVKAFADMDLDTMGRGFMGIGVALLMLVGAMNLMPTDGIFKAALAMVVMSGALLIMSFAVKAFADMDLDTMGRGFIGIGVALLMLVAAMQAMPEKKMLASSIAMIAMGGALLIMAMAVKSFSEMDFGELAKGIGAIAVMLLILVVATNAMTGAMSGALAMIVVAGALYILAEVIKALSQLSLGELGIALLAIAGVFIVLGLAALILAPVIPALLGLAIALALIGGAFALFGLGASLVAKAFETMARAGKKGVEVLIDIIEALIAALPGFVKTLAMALIEAGMTFLDAAPGFIDAVGKIIGKILDKVIELTPKFADAFGALLTAAIDLMREYVPKFISLGIEILLSFMQGLAANIYIITQLAIDILVGFMQALTDNMDMIVTAAVNLITSFATELGNNASKLVTAGVDLLVKLIDGLTQNISKIVTAVGDLIVAFLEALTEELPKIVTKGTELLTALISGISENATLIIEAVVDLITEFVDAIGDGAVRIVWAGVSLVVKLIEGITASIDLVAKAVGDLITEFITSVEDEATRILWAGVAAMVSFLDGLGSAIPLLIIAGVNTIVKFMDGIATGALLLSASAADVIIKFLNALAEQIRLKSKEFRDAGGNIASAIAEGITFGLSTKVGDVMEAAKGLADSAKGAFESALGIFSPSKVFFALAKFIPAGIVKALDGDTSVSYSAASLGEGLTNSFKKSIARIPDSLAGLDDLSPVITPVLDLTRVEGEAKKLAGMMGRPSISPDVSYEKARLISHTNQSQNGSDVVPVDTAPKEFVFNQYINSPTELSTNDIYRNTKSQIALAKEELNIS